MKWVLAFCSTLVLGRRGAKDKQQMISLFVFFTGNCKAVKKDEAKKRGST